MKLDLNVVSVISIVSLVISIILLNGRYRCIDPYYIDPLTKKTCIDDVCFDGWHVLHFGLYFLLTAMLPQYFYVWFFGGIAWEMFEFYSGSSYIRMIHCKDLNVNNTLKWWGGRFSDIVINTFGILIAYLLVMEHN
uniref:Uncharacterized protein n=1 Tax=viral metagenome TaxID=1070528 RepID=A0A6C0J8W2_9ZZZZ